MSIPPGLSSPQGGDPSRVGYPSQSHRTNSTGKKGLGKASKLEPGASGTSKLANRADQAGRVLSNLNPESTRTLNRGIYWEDDAEDDDVEDGGESTERRSSIDLESDRSYGFSDADIDKGQIPSAELRLDQFREKIEKDINKLPFDLDIKGELKRAALDPHNVAVFNKEGNLVQNLLNLCVEKGLVA